MLDHVSLGVRDLERSRSFYDAALKPVGLIRVDDFEGRGSDYDTPERTLAGVFTITREEGVTPLNGLHICFRAHAPEDVMRFYLAALANGGRDDGAPGLRPEYHNNYFAAFVLDPDGHRIEAVCHHGTRQAVFEIVPYQSSDVPALIQFVEAIQEHERIAAPELKPGEEIGRAYAGMLVHKVATRDGCILMAKAGGQNIGFVCAWKEVDDDVLLREDMRAHAYISDIFVVEDRRGRGVAARLLAEVEAVMRRRGYERIRVCAKASNSVAHSCYTRAGYRPYEIIFSKPLA